MDYYLVQHLEKMMEQLLGVVTGMEKVLKMEHQMVQLLEVEMDYLLDLILVHELEYELDHKMVMLENKLEPLKVVVMVMMLEVDLVIDLEQ